MKKNCVLQNIFIALPKKGKIDGDDKISDGLISIKEYLTCVKIWNKFKMKNIGDYHDHYLKKDVLLLEDVFQKFIKTCLKYYDLLDDGIHTLAYFHTDCSKKCNKYENENNNHHHHNDNKK